MSVARVRDVLRLDTALWRALGLFRFGAWLYAAASMAAHVDDYARPALGLAVLVAMGAWTATATWAYGRPEWRRAPLLGADLLLGLAAQQSSLIVLTSQQIDDGAPTVAVCWAAAPVLAWAVHRLNNTLAQLQLHSRTELVRCVIEAGLETPRCERSSGAWI